jgi:hypothetical protein
VGPICHTAGGGGGFRPRHLPGEEVGQAHGASGGKAIGGPGLGGGLVMV